MEEAQFNLVHGLVHESAFDEQRRGRSTEDLYQELQSARPADEELVFTHGDYCLPNVIINEQGVSGFVDWSRAGVADRYKDLALAVRSIRRNLGSGLDRVFFDSYGLSHPDHEKLEYYQLLDEFF